MRIEENITLKGEVVAGARIGRKLGFPTANISLREEVALASGVYAVLVAVEGETYEGMLNLGYKPTVANNDRRSAEVYLFGFEGDLYGKTIEIKPLWFHRPEERFDTIDQLRIRIEQDASQLLKYFDDLDSD